MIQNKYDQLFDNTAWKNSLIYVPIAVVLIGVKDRDCMNEHIQPRQKYPQYSLDMNNIIASCTTKGCCDDAKV